MLAKIENFKGLIHTFTPQPGTFQLGKRTLRVHISITIILDIEKPQQVL